MLSFDVKYVQMQDVCCDPHETLFAVAHHRHYSVPAFCVVSSRPWNSVAHEMIHYEHIFKKNMKAII